MKTEFYQMEYEAWDEGTEVLSLEAEAAYLRFCHQMYRRRTAVQNHLASLARLWRCHPNKARTLLKQLVDAGKILVTPEGHLTNTRVTQELHRRETRSTQASHAGHIGGTRRAQNAANSLKNNDTQQAVASSHSKAPQAIREEERIEEKKDADAVASATFFPSLPPAPPTVPAPDSAPDPEKDFYRRIKEVCGRSAGGLGKQLLDAKGHVALARAAVEAAATKQDPREFIGAIIRGREKSQTLRDKGEAW